MIKSELVQRIAEHNPHLYQRDVENIVNAILDEIVAALEYPPEDEDDSARANVLEQLSQGEISFEDALDLLR